MKADFITNRKSVYESFTLTREIPSVEFDARFKEFDTVYKTPAQKGLLAATYISWLTTVALLGANFYTQYRFRESEVLVSQFGTASTTAQQEQLAQYNSDVTRFSISSQATLYSAIAMAIVSTGIMSWYLYSKDVYVGMDFDPFDKEWYAKFKLEF